MMAETDRTGAAETSRPLPEWCPRVELNAPGAARCGAITRLDDGERHRCYLKVGHTLTHVCWCGRDWKGK